MQLGFDFNAADEPMSLADAVPGRRSSRKRGSGGIVAVRPGVWRVDVETRRDPVTGRRRRVARYVHGEREDAELALARLKVADHERRLPSGGTNARSVAAAFTLYQQAIELGRIELSPTTFVTVRSACRVMARMVIDDRTEFGSIRLGRLTWQHVEQLYAQMRAQGSSPAYIRRCATVLSRALEHVRRLGWIESNPAKDAMRPRTVRRKPFSRPRPREWCKTTTTSTFGLMF